MVRNTSRKSGIPSDVVNPMVIDTGRKIESVLLHVAELQANCTNLQFQGIPYDTRFLSTPFSLELKNDEGKKAEKLSNWLWKVSHTVSKKGK